MMWWPGGLEGDFSASEAFQNMKTVKGLNKVLMMTSLFADWIQSFTASVREMPPVSAIPMAGMRRVS